jgi:hypothetical protein
MEILLAAAISSGLLNVDYLIFLYYMIGLSILDHLEQVKGRGIAFYAFLILYFILGVLFFACLGSHSSGRFVFYTVRSFEYFVIGMVTYYSTRRLPKK